MKDFGELLFSIPDYFVPAVDQNLLKISTTWFLTFPL